jgi:prolyl-tRNA synthetase
MTVQIAAGIYSYLPLGWTVIRKIQDIIRKEMDAAGGQELQMPSVHPIAIWKASGRDQVMKDILFRFEDHHGREFVLSPTHEEITVELFKRNVQSYRDMPQLIYQIASKFRDEPRPRGGLIRLRQFLMKDLYSFDTDSKGLDAAYQTMFDAYQRIFDRCGVPTIPVLADSGAMGGTDTHEFIYLTDIGEDSLLLCPKCDYAANAEVAAFVKEPAHADEDPQPLEEIDTPGQKTIDDVAAFLNVPATKTCKAVFYLADGEPVFIAIRGDMDVNEAKLRNALGATDLVYMTENHVEKAGFVAGSAGAIGLEGTKVIADELVTRERNLVAGANKPDKHLLNTNYERDWKADIVEDIALAREGDLCAECLTPMDLKRGIEMGQVFKLGTRYSETMGAYFLDAQGKKQPAVMGSYGIGIERLLAAVVEANHDENGIVWPPQLAPYDIHIVVIQPDKPGVRETADELYEKLTADGRAVLLDDRDESPGVKFKDADLLGMPVRATVSPRNLKEGAIEVKLRTDSESQLVPVDESQKRIVDMLSAD